MPYKIKSIVTRKFEGVKHFHYYLCRQLKGGGMEIIMKNILMKIKIILPLIKNVPYIIVSFFLIIITSSITTMTSYLYKIIIDSIQLQNIYLKEILFLIFTYIFIQFFGEVLENIQNYLSTLNEFEINNNIKNCINSKLAKISIESYENSYNYDLIARVSEKILSGINETINLFFSFLGPLITIITSSIILFSINIILPIILLSSHVPYIVSLLRQNKRTYNQYKESNGKKRYLDYWINVLTSREYVKDIKVYNLYTFISDKIIHLLDLIFSLERKIMMINLKKKFIPLFIKNFSTGICLISTLYLIYKNYTTLGTFVLIYKISHEITNNLSVTLQQLSQLNNVFLYLDDWEKFLDLPDEPKASNFNFENFNITFSNVFYKYPYAPKDTIRNLSLKITHGEKIAIVGNNGSGKSTFLYLLLGMFFPKKGEIFIGGKNIKEILDVYRNNITCVFQNFIKYQLTIKENIEINNNDNFSQEYSFINKIIEELPLGVDTVLGQLDSGSFELSGGQWQRVAIERACNKKSANILIMDEPTSNIDSVSEKEIILKILEQYYSKTVILVTHNMELCTLFNRILVLEQGKLIEDGSFEELVQKKGKYYQMYISQKNT